MSALSIAVCENHQQREAIGVCVQCRARVCSECATKVEGINYCTRCLAGLAAAGGRTLGRRRPRSLASVYVAASAYFVLGSLAAWLLLEGLMPGG